MLKKRVGVCSTFAIIRLLLLIGWLYASVFVFLRVEMRLLRRVGELERKTAFDHVPFSDRHRASSGLSLDRRPPSIGKLNPDSRSTMAANTGIIAAAAYAEAADPPKELVGDSRLAEVEDEEHPIAPDTFDPRFETSRKEVWAYYSYYVGNNGLSLFNFLPTLTQDLLYQASPDGETLYFFGANRTITSIVLLLNGIAFAIQVFIFLAIGSLADYGTWRPYILIFWSIVAFGVGFASLGVYHPEQYHTSIALYMVGLIAYQMCLTFWTASAPGLARNTATMRDQAQAFEARDITRAQYDHADMMERNRIFNMAFVVQSAGEIVILAVLVGILFALNVNASEANNNYGLAVLIAYVTGCWLLLSLPWFWYEKRRPGQQLPAGKNLFTVMFWTLGRAIKNIWKLRQSFLYLVGYFLLGDSLNTTVTVISTLQYSSVSYNSLTLTYLLIVGIAAQFVGIYGFWLVQKRYGLSTKFMLNVVIVGIVFLDLWGMIGIYTQKFGFHRLVSYAFQSFILLMPRCPWEFWVYQAIYGLWVCPWYSYSQTMISEVTPRGFEFLFFSLFSIMGKTSAFIGPLVSTAIINASPSKNNSLPFYFLLGLTGLSFALLVFCVDLQKSQVEQARFLENEKRIKDELAQNEQLSAMPEVKKF